MAVCTKCGAALANGVAFCSSCGTPVGATAEATQAAGAARGLSMPGIAFNVAALLCYILWPVASIFFLIFDPYNKDKFVRFHAFQSLFLGLAAIAVAFALGILTSILGLIPFIGWIFDFLVWTLYGAGLLGLAIFLMYKAYNGERYRIPFIGDPSARRADKPQ